MTDFRLAVECEIRVRFRTAFECGASFVDIVSGDVHRTVGCYPGRSHRMPMVCKVMRDLRHPSDPVVQSPPKGSGATLKIRYTIPRKIGVGR